MGAQRVQQPARGLSEAEKEVLQSQRPAERFKSSGWYVAPKIALSSGRKFSGLAQFFAVQFIMERQFGGAADSSRWIKVSCATLARMTGLTSKAFEIALEEGARRGSSVSETGAEVGGLIERQKRGREWWYRVIPESWAGVPDYEAPRPIAISDAPEPDPEEVDESAAPAPDPDAPVVFGKSCKPIVLSVSIKGTEEPAEIPFRPRNVSGVPLQFQTAWKSGVFEFTVSRSSVKGEQKASDTEVHFGSTSTTVQSIQQDSELGFVLAQIFKTHFPKKLPDDGLKLQISEALGGAPASQFSEFVNTEVRAMRKKRKDVQTGILKYFAKSFGAAWLASAPAPAAPSPAPAAFATAPDATAWPKIREKLAAVVGAVVAETWFVKSRGVSADGATLVVSVPDAATATFLAEEYAELVDRTAAKVAPGVERVRFVAQGE